MPAPALPRRAARLCGLLLFAALLPFAARAQDHAGHEGHTGASSADPRVGLKAGWKDAGVAARNLTLVGHADRPEGFYNPGDIGDFGFMNSDMAFKGDTMFVGNFAGVQVYDISDPAHPRLRLTIACPGGQGDVSVYGNLLFMSVEETRGRLDCGAGGVAGEVSAERFRGVRIFDITNLDLPQQVAAVQTCRGSHTHTLVPDKGDPDNVYIYISGTSQVRSGDELAGCANTPGDDPNTARFRIEVVRVPLAHPEQARIVNEARFLLGLAAPPARGTTADEVAENLGLNPASAQEAEAAGARGAFTVTIGDQPYVMGDVMAGQVLASIVQQQQRTGAPTAADSATLRQMLPVVVGRMMASGQPEAGGEARPGPDQCHDITVYPEAGLAGGACAGYGILLDISDPANPVRIDQAGDANFAYWHSATFNNDATKVIFTDEWGGGVAPRCRVTDRKEWGADAVFNIENRKLAFQSYYKLPAPQTSEENCVAHNGSLIPVPGRDIMVQAWYQGGLSVFDFTDPSNPVEIAFFDRGPMDSTKMVMGGYWSAYWYDGHIIASEIGRGVDVFRLEPSEFLSASEIAAAASAGSDVVNPQNQTRVVWPASFSVARAYVDQITRAGTVPAAEATRLARTLDEAESMPAGDARQALLAGLARSARGLSKGGDRLEKLASTLDGLGRQP